MLTETVKIGGQCRKCKKGILIITTRKKVDDWQGGMLIQNAMPELTADQREFLMTGICGSCFDEMFRPKDSDQNPEN